MSITIERKVPLRVAVHEAAHAVCGIVLARKSSRTHRVFDYVEVFPGAPTSNSAMRGLIAFSTQCCELPEMSEMAILGGGMADYRHCRAIGMSRLYMSPGQAHHFIEKHIIPQTKRLVAECWSDIRALADELRVKHRIEHNEACAIIDAR